MNTQLVNQDNKLNKFSIKSFTNNKKMEKLTFWIMFNIFYILVGSYLSTTYIISHSMLAEGFIPLLTVNIVIGIIICKKRLFKKNIIYVLMLLAIFLGIISTIFAMKPEIALFGVQFRNEGLISIVYYFSLMFLCSFVRGKYKKTIILFILVVGIINCIYATFEVFGQPNAMRVLQPINDSESKTILFYTWAKGFVLNPNFFGTYMLLCLTYSIGLYLDESSQKKSIIYIVLIAVFMYGLLISKTMSVIIGLLVSLAITIVYCIKNKEYKIFIIILTLVISFSLAHIQGKTTLIEDIVKTKSETVEIAKGNTQDNFGTKRLYIWKKTLQIFPKYWVHGVGIDNFYYAFGDEPLLSPSKRMYYDKAHNEYLQILITQGIFCLIIYLFMYIVICVRGIKQSFKNKKLYLILPIIGYLVQAFFNISVIEVAPMFFIAMGLCLSSQINENSGINDNIEIKKQLNTNIGIDKVMEYNESVNIKKVSVIVPMHNSSKHIEECIGSILNQTYKNLEIIIIDDKSTDNSIEIIKHFSDSRLKLLELPKNIGAANARNKGIDMATGDCICFIDSDDYWVLDKIEKQVKFIEENDYTFIYSDYAYLRTDGTIHIAHVPKSINYEQALKNTTIFTSTVMFNMKYLIKTDIYMPNIKRGQDTATWWKVLRKGIRAYAINEVLAYYRVGEKSSLSSNKFSALKRSWNLYKREEISYIKKVYCFNCYVFNAIKRRL